MNSQKKLKLSPRMRYVQCLLRIVFLENACYICFPSNLFEIILFSAFFNMGIHMHVMMLIEFAVSSHISYRKRSLVMLHFLFIADSILIYSWYRLRK